MMRAFILLAGLGLPALSLASVTPSRVSVHDMYVGEAIYFAAQGDYIDAITRLDSAMGLRPVPDRAPASLYLQAGRSRYAIGDFESSYRMPVRSGNIIRAVLERSNDPLVRNEAMYRIALIDMEAGDTGKALENMEKISGKVPENIREDELFLRARIYMSNGDFVGATKPLNVLLDSRSYKGLASYNLGVALIKSGQEKQGLEQLDKTGRYSGDDEVELSIKDKANLALGFRFADAKQPELAKTYLERVRLTGPFSNRALLGLGWADVARGRFDGALVPWIILARGDKSDKSVQESMLDVPYAYSKLNLPGKAAKHYLNALNEFENELKRLDASIKSVSEGRFLQVLMHNDLRQDENWLARIRLLPDSPETDYLLEMMVADEFQEVMRNFLDLKDISGRLASWSATLDTLGSLRSSASKEDAEQIGQLKIRVQKTWQTAGEMQVLQGQKLEKLAMDELKRRQEQLVEYQDQARVALAESYQRASKAKAPSGGAQ